MANPVLRSSGKRYIPLIVFDPRKVQNAFAIKARNTLGQYTSAQAAVERANRKALTWVQNRAAAELDAAIEEHGRDQEFSTGKLRDAILSDEFSTTGRDGFIFLIDELIEQAVPYYRAIDTGSHAFVDRHKRIVLTFFGHAEGRPAPPILGPRRRGGRAPEPLHYDIEHGYGSRGVFVKEPVPDYQYSRKARDAFRKGGIYKRFIKSELKAANLTFQ